MSRSMKIDILQFVVQVVALPRAFLPYCGHFLNGWEGRDLGKDFSLVECARRNRTIKRLGWWIALPQDVMVTSYLQKRLIGLVVIDWWQWSHLSHTFSVGMSLECGFKISLARFIMRSVHSFFFCVLWNVPVCTLVFCFGEKCLWWF